MSMGRRSRTRGQALVELALVAPLLFTVIAGIVTLGIGVFYQQQVTNAAREAARFAAISSETSQCPVVSNLEPRGNMLPPEAPPDYDCDPPHTRWPVMTGHAREHVFGLNRSGLHIAACWSGYWDEPRAVNPNAYDAAPSKPDGTPNEFIDCEIGGIDPRTDTGSISCPAPLTSASDDTASSLAHSAVPTANQVTVYACYVWTPPFLGEILGTSITLRGVSTEALQHQQ
jgi:TadE-like protein